eukprot:5303120-Amphidinium_carterae.1
MTFGNATEVGWYHDHSLHDRDMMTHVVHFKWLDHFKSATTCLTGLGGTITPKNEQTKTMLGNVEAFQCAYVLRFNVPVYLSQTDALEIKQPANSDELLFVLQQDYEA